MTALDSLDEIILVGFGLETSSAFAYHSIPTTDGYTRICDFAVARSRSDADRRDFIIILASPNWIYGWIRPFSYFSDRGGYDFTNGVFVEEEDLYPMVEMPIWNEFEETYGFTLSDFIEDRLKSLSTAY